MTPMMKALLASALTLPLVAFVAGVLAAPGDVDPDRSRPVIIGHVGDDSRQGDPTGKPGRDGGPEGDRDGAPPDDDTRDDDTRDDTRDDDPGEGDIDDRPFTVVTPPPRDLDDDEDGGDDDNDDDTDDSRESRDD